MSSFSISVGFLITLIGISSGSFVSALVWRLKKKRNWITERSECSKCGHSLSLVDLVPIISYILLKGKCRYCHKSIEDSPLTEIAVGLAFILSYFYWPFEFDGVGLLRFILWLVCIVILAAMFLYDLRWTVLPDKLTRTLLFLALIQLILIISTHGYNWDLILLSISSTIVGGGIFHLLYELSKGKYIGGGDVKLGYAYGLLLLDPLLSWMVLTIASVLGSIVATILIVKHKKTLRSSLPFGPFLIVGVFITVLFGQKLWAYINTLMLY